MTTRKTQFTAATVPVEPLKQSAPSQPNTESETNPLTAFFRKSKLSLSLPSRGKWYPVGSLNLDQSGGLPVYAMTATDDIKIRTGDATMTGRNIYEVIQSCIPGITQPEFMPHIDLDSALLAIRIASYGSVFNFNISVPNTKLTRTISLDANELLVSLQKVSSSENSTWDETVKISDETGQSLIAVVQPIPIKNLFQTSKSIFMQRRALTKNFDADENIKDDAIFTASMAELSNSAINLLASSIHSLKVLDKNGSTVTSLTTSNPQDAAQITQIIHQLDIEYFNAIRDHLDQQRKKYQFMTPMQTSTPKEVSAGAPETWSTELTFMGSDFLPEQKNIPNLV
jgi:hypothetical protein